VQTLEHLLHGQAATSSRAACLRAARFISKAATHLASNLLGTPRVTIQGLLAQSLQLESTFLEVLLEAVFVALQRYTWQPLASHQLATERGWATCGPQAKCGPLKTSVQPMKRAANQSHCGLQRKGKRVICGPLTIDCSPRTIPLLVRTVIF